MPREETQKENDTVIYANSLFAVKPHRKVTSANSYIVALRNEDFKAAYPTFLDLINQDSGQSLKTFFEAVAKGTAQRHSGREIFWLVNATDDSICDTNHTHSKESAPHAHVIRGPLPEDYKYGYILREKTYTPSPRNNFKERLQKYMSDCDMTLADESKAIFPLPLMEGIKESPAQIAIAAPNFRDFLDFVERAEKLDYLTLNAILEGWLNKAVPDGGARIVCNDFEDMGIFTLRIQSGDQEHKWFERPGPA